MKPPSMAYPGSENTGFCGTPWPTDILRFLMARPWFSVIIPKMTDSPVPLHRSAEFKLTEEGTNRRMIADK